MCSVIEISSDDEDITFHSYNSPPRKRLNFGQSNDAEISNLVISEVSSLAVIHNGNEETKNIFTENDTKSSVNPVKMENSSNLISISSPIDINLLSSSNKIYRYSPNSTIISTPENRSPCNSFHSDHSQKFDIEEISIANDLPIIYICLHCRKEYYTRVHIESHNYFCHRHWPLKYRLTKKFRCSLCTKIGSLKNMKNHFMKIHLNMPFIVRNFNNQKQCGCCDYICKEHFFYPELKDHFLNNHKQPLKINFNFLTDNVLDKLINERTEHLVPNFYKCSKCNCCFQLYHYCYDHIRTAHSDGEDEDDDDDDEIIAITYDVLYGCMYCHIYYINEIDVLKHVKLMHLKTLRCKYCSFRALNRESVLEHCAHSHKLDNAEYYRLNYMEFLSDYKRIAIEFSNGLVLRKNELEATKYGDEAKLIENIRHLPIL